MSTPRKLTMTQGGALRVREFSDADLLTAILETRDPTKLANLSTESPPEGAALDFEMTYDADQEVMCVLGHRHKKGLVLRDRDGTRYCFGHDCGRTQFGLDWQLMDNERVKLHERQSYLLRLRSIGAAINTEWEWLRALPSAPSVVAYDEVRAEIIRFCRPLFNACKSAGEGDGQLYAEVDERDHAAERRRRDREEEEKREFAHMSASGRARYMKKHGAPKTSANPLFSKRTVSVGVLRGAGLFVRGNLSARLKSLVDQMGRLASTALQLPPTGDLRQMSITGTSLVRELNETAALIDEAVAFFEIRHIDTLVRWLNLKQFPGLNFSAGADEFRLENEGEQETRVLKRPPELTSILLDPIRRILAVVGGPTATVNPGPRERPPTLTEIVQLAKELRRRDGGRTPGGGTP